MINVADQLFLSLLLLQQALQAFLALAQRQRAKILTIGKQEIECKEDEVAGLVVRDRRLQRGKTGHAVVVQRDDFAVDQRIRQRLGCSRDGAELVGPVQPFSGQQRYIAILDPQLHAVAVELDFMAPAVRVRRPLDGGAKLRRDEIRHRGNLLRLGALRRRAGFRLRRGSQCCCFPAGARLGGIAPVRLPDRVGLCFALASMNGFGALPLPCAICAIVRPEATERSSSRISLASPSLANSSRCLISSQLVRLPP